MLKHVYTYHKLKQSQTYTPISYGQTNNFTDSSVYWQSEDLKRKLIISAQYFKIFSQYFDLNVQNISHKTLEAFLGIKFNYYC